MNEGFQINLGGGLPGIIEAQIATIIGALNYVWAVLVSAADYLNAVDNMIGSTLLDTIKSVGGLFKHIWQVVWTGIIAKLIADYQRLHAWLKRLLGPLLKILQKIMAWYVNHILPILKTILNLIQTLRVILELFRLLGQQWAVKLDADLQKIQSYITESIQLVVGNLNAVMNIMGIAIDPAMLVRKDFFGRSLWNSLGDVKRAAGYGSARPVYASEHAQEDSVKNAVVGNAPLMTQNPDGSIIYDPAVVLVDQGIDKAARTYGIGY